MAKTPLFRVGKVWHYRFQLDGKRQQRSTGETERTRAERIAGQALRDAELWARNGRAVPTLAEVVARWIAIHEASASPAHLKVVETVGRLHLYDLADTPVDELTTERVERARVRYLESHAPASANQWLKVLRLLCNWAIRCDLLPAMPFRVCTLKVQKKPRAILPVNLALDWLAAVDAHEGSRRGVCTAVRLMIGLGLRESETITARWEWLDRERALYTPGRTKGREAEPLPVPAWLLDYLAPLHKPAGLIVTRPDGSAFYAGFTRNAMLAANQATGAPHVTAHRLRGTFATLLSEAGVPVQSIQRTLRHKNLTTTAAYLEVDMHTVAQGQQRIAEKIGFGLPPAPTGATVANSAPQGPS